MELILYKNLSCANWNWSTIYFKRITYTSKHKCTSNVSVSTSNPALVCSIKSVGSENGKVQFQKYFHMVFNTRSTKLKVFGSFPVTVNRDLCKKAKFWEFPSCIAA